MIIPVVTFCPACSKQHLDEGEWVTRPHRTHRCVDDSAGKGCGNEWKIPDIDVFTVGVVEMRLWLDDIRKPPWGYDLMAKTADECIEKIQDNHVTHCSLDHDLHEEHYAHQQGAAGYMESPPPWDRSKFKEKTGLSIIEWMAENRWVQDISVHSLSSGAEDMMNKLKK